MFIIKLKLNILFCLEKDPRFVGAISVPNLSSLPDNECMNNRFSSDPVIRIACQQQHSKSIAFGMNNILEDRVTLEEDSNHSKLQVQSNMTSSTIQEEEEESTKTMSHSDSIASSKSSFHKYIKHTKPRINRFEHKSASRILQVTNSIGSNTLPSNLSPTQYGSCICLSPTPSTIGNNLASQQIHLNILIS